MKIKDLNPAQKMLLINSLMKCVTSWKAERDALKDGSMEPADFEQEAHWNEANGIVDALGIVCVPDMSLYMFLINFGSMVHRDEPELYSMDDLRSTLCSAFQYEDMDPTMED